MAGIAEFLSVFIPSAVLFVAFLVAFSFLRRKYPRFYEPRRLLLAPDPGLAPPEAAGRWWIKRCLLARDEEVLRSVGLDAFVLLYFVRTALKIFLVLTLVAGVTLLPVYGHGANDFGDVDMFTLANLENESKKLWAPCILTWVVSLIVYYFLYHAYSTVTGPHVRSTCMYHRYVGGPERHTIMVFDIPAAYRTDAKVKAFFEQFYPGEVRCATVAVKCDKLREAVEELRAAKKALAHSEAEFAATGQRPAHRPLTAPQLGKVDSIDFYRGEMDRLSGKVKKEREKELEPTDVAFVSFTTVMTAAKAAQGWYAPTGWRATEAPEPRDVFWPNLAMSEQQRVSRRALVTAATGGLIFFWMIPVAAISALTTLDNLKSSGFIKSIVEASPALETFLTGFLPTLALILFMALLPMILLELSKQEGLHSWSLLQLAVLEKLYMFEVLNVFFVTALSSALLQSIEAIVDSPGSTPKLLGEAIPKVSTTFTSYVTMQALGRYSMEILRVVPFILGPILGMRSAYTEEEKGKCEDPGYGSGFGVWSAAPLLIFTISIIYSVIAPLILPFAVLFFAVCLIILTHQLLFTYRPMYQFNGRLWPTLFTRAVVGLFIMQMTMVGVLSLKYAKAQGPLLVPLPVLTLVFLRTCHCRFRRHTQETPLGALLGAKAIGDLSSLDTAYVHPSLRPVCDFALLPTDPVFLEAQVVTLGEAHKEAAPPPKAERTPSSSSPLVGAQDLEMQQGEKLGKHIDPFAGTTGHPAAAQTGNGGHASQSATV
eukprot:TRINITY_DN6396_c0_g1_i1.p1 TRINITY_DN6396_c0_g1~~TRINITY_DN6396_c0_g1_i1.p1  ORF type:complete len:796 (+),score=264.54 TRINITY_DN6396_c0_g1_i1:87-2390(+)